MPMSELDALSNGLFHYKQLFMLIFSVWIFKLFGLIVEIFTFIPKILFYTIKRIIPATFKGATRHVSKTMLLSGLELNKHEVDMPIC
jgi:hypothetical protein